MNDRDLLPNIPIVNNEPPSSYLSPSVVQLNAEGANSLIHDQDITTLSGFIQLNNPELFQQNTNFNGSVDAGTGTGTGIPNEHFMTNNQISLPPHLQNYYINHHMTWDSQGVEPYLQPTLVPMPPNLYDNQHAYIPLMLSEPHVSFGYDNQNNQYHSQAMISDGNLEQGVSSFVQLSGRPMQVVDQRNDVHNQLLNAPNLQGHSSTMHEHATLSGSQVMGSRIVGLSGFRMVEGSSQFRVYDTTRLLRPTTMYPNYHTHPRELSGARNVLGSAGPSVPIIYDNMNHQFHSQGLMPDGHVEQGVGNNMQFSGGLARMVYEGNEEQNQILGASSIQGQGSAMYQPSTLPSNLIGQQVTGSRNMGLLGITITDGTSSQAQQVSDTAGLLRPERASSSQLQQAPPVSTKRPTMWKHWKGKNGEEYEPPRRGRPRKRFEVGESSSCPKHQKTEKKDSRGIGNGTTYALEEPNNTPENLRNEVQISNPTNPNPSHAATNNPREFSTGLYGQNQTHERNGVSTDPLLRLFKPPPGNYNYIL
ncbi:unnamed protein product [Lupinus luteus]|uniref:Uncharacterized protein n=1 Tax=Lupinus luteus TaxID=3873 RepID=A0AAV1W991_LUPLU